MLSGFEREHDARTALAQVITPELQFFEQVVVEHPRLPPRDLLPTIAELIVPARSIGFSGDNVSDLGKYD